ncbi:MAG TPA: aldo/keto reductase [Candidatus Limnocylindrales bacterium]|nr:aldo/keto reductase [Candidatus Limnocylindrales bacterium]
MPVKDTLTLPRRPLGVSGLQVTAVGIGTWAVGGGGCIDGWGAQDDRDSIAAIHRALDEGVGWIDTAAVYGLGHSEEVVGRAIADIPGAQRPLIFTKCGLQWDERDRFAELTRSLRPQTIRRECEASLRRLGVDHIDLYQFHDPDRLGTPVEESWGEMQRLIAEGKVRWGGVSNFDVSLLERCERIHHVTSLQPPFSAIARDAAAGLLPWCAAHGTGVIVYSPMQSGLLTDSFTAARAAALPDDDWRRASDDHREPRLARNLELRDALRALAQRRGTTTSAIAIAWVLAWPQVSGAIVGARRPAQVDGWIGGARITLTPAELEEIADAIARTGAGSGPLKPA